MNHGKPDSPMSAGELLQALRHLGEWDEARDRIVALLRDYEAHRSNSPSEGFNVRESVSGPILDATIGYGTQLDKTLSTGLSFSVGYTSKIIRDFILSGDEEPDHVWEPQTTKTLLALSRNAANVIIGGAYIGDHAVLIADQLRGSGIVHCFELSSENTRLLTLNAARNGLDNIRVNQVGLWSEPDVRLSLEGEDSHASPRVSDEGFSATTIEAYAAKNGLASVDLIMLDIEGGELEALKGAEAYLILPPEKAPEIVFEIHASYSDWSRGLQHAEIVEHLADRGYTLLAIRDYQSNVAMSGRPVELVEIDDVYIEGPKHGFNMLATKRPTELDRDMFRRVRGVSPKLLFHRDPKLHHPIA